MTTGEVKREEGRDRPVVGAGEFSAGYKVTTMELHHHENKNKLGIYRHSTNSLKVLNNQSLELY